MKTVTLATLIAAISLSGLTGCQSPKNHGQTPPAPAAPVIEKAEMSEAEKTAVGQLQWIVGRNPEQDARDALASGSPVEIIAIAGRGLRYPGLSKQQFMQIENKVTAKVAEGSGDTIYGNTHRDLRRQLMAYATRYNQAIYAGLQ